MVNDHWLFLQAVTTISNSQRPHLLKSYPAEIKNGKHHQVKSRL
jgi:hypothetical protein